MLGPNEQGQEILIMAEYLRLKQYKFGFLPLLSSIAHFVLIG